MIEFTSKDLPEWQVRLIEKFPLLYLEHDDRIPCPEDSPCNLRFGFEFGEGWVELVEMFSEQASCMVEALREELQPDAYIHSFIFKEKFGSLRWQGEDNLIQPYSDKFRRLVRNVEERSGSICEICGKPGTLRESDYWMRVRCDEHDDGKKRNLLDGLEDHLQQ